MVNWQCSWPCSFILLLRALESHNGGPCLPVELEPCRGARVYFDYEWGHCEAFGPRSAKSFIGRCFLSTTGAVVIKSAKLGGSTVARPTDSELKHPQIRRQRSVR